MAGLTVSAGLAAGLVECAERRGADRVRVLKRAELSEDALADPDARIAFQAYVALTVAAEAESGDPALSLHYGAEVDLAEVSIVGLIMNASPTFADAFAQMQRFGQLTAEVQGVSDGPRYQIAQRGDQIWLVDTRSDTNAFPQLTESGFARLATGPRRFLSEPHVLEAHFSYPEPSYGEEYRRVFQCPVRFRATWNALRLHPDLGSWRVALQPKYVFGVLVDKAEDLLKSLEASETTRGRVERLLLPILHTGDVGALTIARSLGISRQTLFRQLTAEETSFKQVLDDLRHRLALHYLSASRASVNETAYLVGFSDPAAFSRAFKRWTGLSPRTARARSRL
jgi:AraC-like DNA-binding protein